LAGRSALRIGAGKVFIGFMQDRLPWPCDPLQPELMCRCAEQLLENDPGVTVWVAGCGASTSEGSLTLLRKLLAQTATPDAASVPSEQEPGRGSDGSATTPLVLDADGLNLLAEGKLALAHPASTVLTPHPGEAGRLLGCSTAEIQADRPAAARALAVRYGAWIVLKGAETLVSEPDGLALTRNTTGNAGLATAGTGDVLAGAIGSLLAQGIHWRQAIEGAVWLHGAAADRCAASGAGPIGLTASEIADEMRTIRNNLLKNDT
ncbi:MAG: NAD(P)H-hydrate dehydratase, partial [Burkholderiaceae bacterium]|nr:NAD(P)H-hydrate dehydratase [Burkholderiaceae bacterium]